MSPDEELGARALLVKDGDEPGGQRVVSNLRDREELVAVELARAVAVEEDEAFAEPVQLGRRKVGRLLHLLQQLGATLTHLGRSFPRIGWEEGEKEAQTPSKDGKGEGSDSKGTGTQRRIDVLLTRSGRATGTSEKKDL